jgi:hypothetical protein
MSIVSEYLDEHKEVLLRDNPGCNESWLANEYMGKKSLAGSRIGFLNRILIQVNNEKVGSLPYIHHCDISRVRRKWIHVLHRTTR